MRHARVLVVLIAVGLAVTALGGIAAASPRLPRLIAGSYDGIRPKTIGFSADGGNIVTNLRWRYWRASGAYGVGTSLILSCVPNCASGKARRVRTTISLSRPRGGHFTRIVEIRVHRRYVGYYRRAGWPLGAQ